MSDPHRIDAHKLMFHPRRVAAWREVGGDWERAKEVYPLYVEVSPVGACNHRCTFCAVDYIGYKAKQLGVEVLSERLREMGSLGVKSVMYAGEGEPLLHKGINEIVVATVDAGVDAAFTTNAVLLDKLEELARCEWVKVSLNAGTRATYAAVHRCKEKDWDTVWRNLKGAVARKGKCTIGVQTLLLPENEKEVLGLAALCQDTGVDYLVVKPYSQHKFSITRQYEGVEYAGAYKLREQLALFDSDRFQVVFRDEAMATTEHDYAKCSATPYFWAYVMASGDVYSCSAYLLDERFRLGNLNEQSFREIWQGERRRANWALVGGALDIRECRVNCRMDKANRYLADFDRVSHVNFV